MGDLDGMLANLPVPHADGRFISERVSRIAELVRDYDPNLDVRWISPEHRAPLEPAFAIVEKMPNGMEAVAFYVQEEKDFDGSVLERIYQMDAAKHGNMLNAMDARNEAVKAIQGKLHKEQRDEAIDVAYHVLRSPKHTYKHDGVVYE